MKRKSLEDLRAAVEGIPPTSRQAVAQHWTLAVWVKNYREGLGLTVEDLACKAEVGVRTIKAIESAVGKQRVSKKMLDQTLDALQFPSFSREPDFGDFVKTLFDEGGIDFLRKYFETDAINDRTFSERDDSWIIFQVFMTLLDDAFLRAGLLIAEVGIHDRKTIKAWLFSFLCHFFRINGLNDQAFYKHLHDETIFYFREQKDVPRNDILVARYHRIIANHFRVEVARVLSEIPKKNGVTTWVDEVSETESASSISPNTLRRVLKGKDGQIKSYQKAIEKVGADPDGIRESLIALLDSRKLTSTYLVDPFSEEGAGVRAYFLNTPNPFGFKIEAATHLAVPDALSLYSEHAADVTAARLIVPGKDGPLREYGNSQNKSAVDWLALNHPESYAELQYTVFLNFQEHLLRVFEQATSLGISDQRLQKQLLIRWFPYRFSQDLRYYGFEEHDVSLRITTTLDRFLMN